MACCCAPSCEPTRETVSLTISNITASDANIICKFGTFFTDLAGTYILTKPAMSPFGVPAGPCSADYTYVSASFSIALQVRPGNANAYGFINFSAGGGCNGCFGGNCEMFIPKSAGKELWSQISAGSMTSPIRTERVFANFFPNGFRLDIGSVDLVLSD